MVNQLQLFFLLLLTKAFIPAAVQTAIGGSNSAMVNPFEFIPFLDSKKYGQFFEKFNYALNNAALKPFKIKSFSTIYNSFSVVLGVVYVIVFHVLLFGARKLTARCSVDGRCGKLVKIAKTAIGKVFDIMTFGLYVRLSLELFQFFLVSCVNEIYNADVSDGWLVASFVVAVLTLAACVLFLVFVTYFSLSASADDDGHGRLNEFFSGMRLDKRNRLFISVMLGRRFALIVLLFILSSIPSRVLVGVLVAVDAPYVVYVALLRPYSELKYNIIEIVNECVFLLLLGSLIFVNTESDWSVSFAHIYVQTISCNCMFSLLIIIGKSSADTVVFMIVAAVKWVINRKKNNTTVS